MSDFEKYTQGVCEDGAAIICDGVMMTIEEVLDALNARTSPIAFLTDKEWWDLFQDMCHAHNQTFGSHESILVKVAAAARACLAERGWR